METAILTLVSINITISIFLFRELDEIRKAFIQILNAVQPNDEEEDEGHELNTYI